MSSNDQVQNPFGDRVPASASANNAIANSDVERSIQEVQASMVIAKRFPRDTRDAMNRILNACTRETLANAALYSYPRGGQEISGPSIRLAEAMAQEWGNIQFGIRELSSENGASTVEAFAWDVQTNTRQVKVFQVAHTRYSKNKGLVKLTDPRDIYEMIANNGARRLRACILGVIPGDVTEAAIHACEVTQKNSVDVRPETIKSMLEAFKTHYGVDQELVERRIGKRAEAISASQLLSLRKIFQSLKDGMSRPSNWFDIEEGAESVQPKTTSLKRQAANPVSADDPNNIVDEEPAPDTVEAPEPEPTAAEPESPAFMSLKKELFATRRAEDAIGLGNSPALGRVKAWEIKEFGALVDKHLKDIEAGLGDK